MLPYTHRQIQNNLLRFGNMFMSFIQMQWATCGIVYIFMISTSDSSWQVNLGTAGAKHIHRVGTWLSTTVPIIIILMVVVHPPVQVLLTTTTM